MSQFICHRRRGVRKVLIGIIIVGLGSSLGLGQLLAWGCSRAGQRRPRNFYAVIREKDSGRGAFEILLDPSSGAITSELGPNMMWNAKYGHLGGWAGGDNTLMLEQARDLAQKALAGNEPGGKVHQEARAFYGYYMFDYESRLKGKSTLSPTAPAN